MIMCPYCLKNIQEPLPANLCSNPDCGHKLPPRYVEYARKGQITSLGTFGLPQHGKTALVSSLMESAQGVHKIVPGSHISPQGDETLKLLNEWRSRFNTGNVNMPSTTPRERPLPLLLQNNKFLASQPSMLVAYDLAGEALVNAGGRPELVRALRKVNTIWCVVSLDDLMRNNGEGYDLAGLFTTYREAMTNFHMPIKRKNILIVYTKADLLFGDVEGLAPLPEEVYDYVQYDPYCEIRTKRGAELPPFDEDTYFARMCQISEVLQEYTIDFVPGGGAFVNMIAEEGANVYFTINSAFGSALAAGNTKAAFAVAGHRVLDPLIWAIKLDRHDSIEQEVALIVPASMQNSGLASQEAVRHFFEELSAGGGHVATYYPGQISPAFPVGVTPAVTPATDNLNLICPILDNLKPNTAVVLLVDKNWPIDFFDLFGTHWPDRLLLVVGGRELVATGLPHRRVYQNDGSIPQIVNGFLDHLETLRANRA